MLKEAINKYKDKLYIGLITVIILAQILGFPTVGSLKEVLMTTKVSKAQRAVYFHFRDYKEKWKKEMWRFPNLSEFLYNASINIDDNSDLTETLYHFVVGDIKYDENSNRTTFIKHAETEKKSLELEKIKAF